jgi:hypothetical protein
MAVGAVVARIISQYSDKGSKAAQKDIAKLGKNIDRFAAKATKAFGLAAAASFALAVKLGKDAVQGAMADEKQQAALAVALRNTTGATQEAIDANSKYLDSLELQVAIDNEQLIPALQKLVTATGDLALGQQLLTLATDVSAASGKDLSSVSTALSRAFGGNFTALTRLGLPLDQAAVQSKDLIKILDQLAEISQGQASAAADTFAGRMETLRLRFAQVMDEVGYALIPVLEDFVGYIVSDILPGIQAWVDANKEQLVESLKAAAEFAKDFLKVAGGIAKWATENTEKLKVIGGIIVGMFVVGRIAAFITALKTIIGVYQLIAASATAAAIAGAFATGGANIAAGTLALVGAGIAWRTYAVVVDNAGKSATDASKASADYAKKQALAGFKAIETATKVANSEKAKADAIKAAALAAAKAAKDLAKSDKDKAKRDAIEKKNAALKKKLEDKFGVKITDKDEYENIQLTAVAKLQAKQKQADKSLQDRIKLRQEELDAFKKIGSTEISDKEVKKLQLAWGMTKEQAKQYLDFLKVVGEGPISEENIKKLAKTWYGSDDASAVSAARKYAGFVEKLGDGTLSQKDLETLKANWGLTDKQVVDYIAKIGVKADASGTVLSAGDIAAIGWTNALNSLDTYLTKLNTGVTPTKPFVPGTSTSTILGGSRSDSAATAAETAANNANTLARFKAKEASDEAAAKAIAAAQAAADVARQASTLAAARAKEAAEQAASQLAIQIQNQKIMSSYAAFRAKEAADEAAYNTFKSNTLSNTSGIMGSGGNNRSTVVNLTVNGSVSTEQDLVTAVRNGLLSTQYNGSQITLQAI